MRRILAHGAHAALVLALAGVALLAVHGSRTGTPSAVGPEVVVPTAVALCDEQGGELALAGATLRVPQGALGELTSLSMETTRLPAPLKKGFRAASPVVRLTKTNGDRFLRPVSVTLPVDARAHMDELVPLYWDVEHELYRTLTVTQRDAVARTITFETIHFTDFLVSSPEDEDFADPRAPLANTDTGFTPERDGFFFTNGDYDSSGTCLGMSLLSAWYFEAHRNDPTAPRLHDLMASFHPVADTADLVGREMALAAQRAAIPPGQYLAEPSKVALDEAKRRGLIPSGVHLWDQLRVTGTPQLIVIQGPRGAHAIVAYAYVDGAFLIYDPNFPELPRRFPFDRVRGFHDFEGTDLGSPLEVAPVSFSSYAADVDFQKIFDQALADRGTPERYRDVSISSAEVDHGQLEVRGRVTGGLASPRDKSDRVTIVVGGVSLTSGYLRDDGTFTLRAPLKMVVETALREHAAPAVVVGERWSFAGAEAVPATEGLPAPAAPSETPGALSVLETVAPAR